VIQIRNVYVIRVGMPVNNVLRVHQDMLVLLVNILALLHAVVMVSSMVVGQIPVMERVRVLRDGTLLRIAIIVYQDLLDQRVSSLIRLHAMHTELLQVVERRLGQERAVVVIQIIIQHLIVLIATLPFLV
jgi:hypothetical protein